jgi:hypothetical protein
MIQSVGLPVGAADAGRFAISADLGHANALQ